jgi:hypothetical protein
MQCTLSFWKMLFYWYIDQNVHRILKCQRNGCKMCHWLPIEQRIDFKILLLCYKAHYDNGPDYLKELLIPYHPSRSLRSGSSNLLVQPKSNMKSYGDRAFGIAGPNLWNKLPDSVKNCDSVHSFKKSLKTHLFRAAFNE